MPRSASRSPAAPPRSIRSARAIEIIAAAREILEHEGSDALTMRRLADELGIRAPSIYKHFSDKAALESGLVEDALAEMGEALHRAVSAHAAPLPGRRAVVDGLLQTYRSYSVGHPNLYRMATSGQLDRAALPPGLEEWAGEPFFLATGDAHRAQALWAFAHGMVILEIDRRFLDASDLGRTWRAAAGAFSGSR